MPGVSPELGMVWMGTGAEQLMMEDSPFYPSHSNHSMEDVGQQTNPMELDSFGMLDYSHGSSEKYHSDDLDTDTTDYSHMEFGENEFPMPCMQSIATQTVRIPNRKIRPIKHPGLILKTPIAYQSDTDPSVIPIQKDGMAVCEKCGAIGVKHAFYTRERRFCSMACARGYNGLSPEPANHVIPINHNNVNAFNYQNYKSSELMSNNMNCHDIELDIKPVAVLNPSYKFKMISNGEDLCGMVPQETLPQLTPPPVLTPMEDAVQSVRRKPSELANSFDWTPQLQTANFLAAPVPCFRHCPVVEIWDNVTEGMKVEVENTDCDNFSDSFPDSFWVAKVLKITGYKALMRYEGFGSNDIKDFWVNLCSAEVHPVGWCATRGKPLIPPRTIQNKYSDWKEFLVKRLTGARTLPSTFYNKISESMKSRFQCGLNLEVVDKNRISQVKVAMVHKIVGKRLHVRYYDSTPEDNGFWCHEDSPLIHPVGWAKKVGHTLDAPTDYIERINEGIWDEDDACEELFKPTPNSYAYNDLNISSRFSVGMKLEAIDPLNLSTICVATVMDVLKYGYIMIKIDNYAADPTGADWFCYHEQSPCIFPVGFCAANNITLTPPYGYDVDTFSWEVYLQEINNIAAGVHLFDKEVPAHGFVEGMKLECADLMDPRLVCVATVARVVGRLLKVQFDGWDAEYDQWLDCESPDIYPIGWCCLVGHKLEGPHVPPKPTPLQKTPPKGQKRKGRKKKSPKEVIPKAANTSTAKLRTAPLDLVQPKLEPPEPPELLPMKDDVEEGEEEGAVEEPTAAPVPAGPDQSLPVPSEQQPPPERKATSYINCMGTTNKVIPRLVDSSGSSTLEGELTPAEWSVFDVAQFLRVNDCTAYCDTFSKNKIDGKGLLGLTKDEIVTLLGMKVGPALKIFDLIQQLKCKVNPAQSRLLKASLNKKFL